MKQLDSLYNYLNPNQDISKLDKNVIDDNIKIQKKLDNINLPAKANIDNKENIVSSLNKGASIEKNKRYNNIQHIDNNSNNIINKDFNGSELNANTTLYNKLSIKDQALKNYLKKKYKMNETLVNNRLKESMNAKKSIFKPKISYLLDKKLKFKNVENTNSSNNNKTLNTVTHKNNSKEKYHYVSSKVKDIIYADIKNSDEIANNKLINKKLTNNLLNEKSITKCSENYNKDNNISSKNNNISSNNCIVESKISVLKSKGKKRCEKENKVITGKTKLFNKEKDSLIPLNLKKNKFYKEKTRFKTKIINGNKRRNDRYKRFQKFKNETERTKENNYLGKGQSGIEEFDNLIKDDEGEIIYKELQEKEGKAPYFSNGYIIANSVSANLKNNNNNNSTDLISPENNVIKKLTPNKANKQLTQKLSTIFKNTNLRNTNNRITNKKECFDTAIRDQCKEFKKIINTEKIEKKLNFNTFSSIKEEENLESNTTDKNKNIINFESNNNYDNNNNNIDPEIADDLLSDDGVSKLEDEILLKVLEDNFNSTTDNTNNNKYTAFKDGQLSTIKNILNNKRTLSILGSNSGKSLCFQLPSLVFDGLTLFISPYVNNLHNYLINLPNCLSGACLTGSTSNSHRAEILESIEDKKVKVLFITPERLYIEICNSIFKDVSLIVFDEAINIIPNNINNQRSVYYTLIDIINNYTEIKFKDNISSDLTKLDCSQKNISNTIITNNSLFNPFYNANLLLLCSYADDDNINKLTKLFNIEEIVNNQFKNIDNSSLDIHNISINHKPNLKFYIIKEDESRKNELLVSLIKSKLSKEVLSKNNLSINHNENKTTTDLNSFSALYKLNLNTCFFNSNNTNGSILILANFKKKIDEITSYLNQNGLVAQSYHSGKSESERRTILNAYISNKNKILVSTYQIIYGLKKKDIRALFIYDIPSNIETFVNAYSRCGLDNVESNVYCLLTDEDYYFQKNLILSEIVDETLVYKFIEYMLNLNNISSLTTINDKKANYFNLGLRNKRSICDIEDSNLFGSFNVGKYKEKLPIDIIVNFNNITDMLGVKKNHIISMLNYIVELNSNSSIIDTNKKVSNNSNHSNATIEYSNNEIKNFNTINNECNNIDNKANNNNNNNSNYTKKSDSIIANTNIDCKNDLPENYLNNDNKCYLKMASKIPNINSNCKTSDKLSRSNSKLQQETDNKIQSNINSLEDSIKSLKNLCESTSNNITNSIIKLESLGIAPSILSLRFYNTSPEDIAKNNSNIKTLLSISKESSGIYKLNTLLACLKLNMKPLELLNYLYTLQLNKVLSYDTKDEGYFVKIIEVPKTIEYLCNKIKNFINKNVYNNLFKFDKVYCLLRKFSFNKNIVLKSEEYDFNKPIKCLEDNCNYFDYNKLFRDCVYNTINFKKNLNNYNNKMHLFSKYCLNKEEKELLPLLNLESAKDKSNLFVR